MHAPKLLLRELPGDYAVSRLAAGSDTPDWVNGPGLVTVTSAEDETSILCLRERVPAEVKQSAGWTAIQVSNLFDFDEPGVVVAATRPVAEAGLGIFVVSTFDRDYLLVRQDSLHRAELAWLGYGHRVQRGQLFLRNAEISDCDAIAAFHLRIWRQTYGAIAPTAAVEALNFDRRQEQWRVKLSGNREQSVTLLAEDEQGQLMGLCDLTGSTISGFEDALEITHLYLDEKLRGQGVGRYFLNLAQHIAQRFRKPALVLEVVRENTAALDFYRACGGDPVAEQTYRGPLWPSDNVIIRWSSDL
ncbi:GNAT family N-acetyltransferase [Parasedimentitalea maritima]|uniref:GNAT family N-acetyltransferase n=1 Tax=Parasedimentitalea maritima TaxID=2578117 RepID=A0A6A4RCQ1_9RHOB|nr:GNAT family N-acetyltransferase [Zongyanglinia marina]KAE9630485.1 GNAT family N-acetyltransferase [Zongyanglinia marina]